MIPTGLPSGGSFFPVASPISQSPGLFPQPENTTDDIEAAGSNSGYNYQSFKDMLDASYAQQLELDQMEREFNSGEAQKNRDWQEMMSNTAYQRAVADLEKAGLNKWLAVNGGSINSASTPSGAQASASSGSSQYPQLVKAFLTWMSTLTSSAWKAIAGIIPF